MDKANLIISIIIVLCVATAVAAYGIINNQDAVFSDLASMDSGSSDSGSGNNIGNNTTHTGTSTSSSGSSSGSSGSGSGSSGSGSGSGTRNGGSGSGSGGGNGGGSGSSVVHSSTQIQNIAMNHVDVSGCYAGTPSYSNGYWYIRIYNSTDNSVVSSFMINDKTEHVDLW